MTSSLLDDRHIDGSTSACLVVHDVTVEFGGLRALSNVSASVSPGEVLGVVGPNGAGKTTLFNVISGVVRPTTGQVRLDGVDVTNDPPHIRSHRGLARTFQNLGLDDEISVLENVLIGAQRRLPLSVFELLVGMVTRRAIEHEKQARREAMRVLDRLQLLDVRERLVSELPFGTRRRIDMARALCSDPRTLLLDEPFSGLGERERPLMAEMINDVRDGGGVGMILVEHDMAVITELCDRVLVLNEGRCLVEGDPSTILADPLVQEAYLGPQLKRQRRSRT